MKRVRQSTLLAFLCNMLLAYAVYMVCRIAFVCENWSLYAEGWSALDKWELLRGGLRFDTSAIIYTNILYALMMLLPLRLKERLTWQSIAKWLFVVVNSIAMAVNLIDSVYSQYTGRRTTFSFFKEFQNDNNLGAIVGVELLNHWYLVLLGIALVVAMVLLYQKPTGKSPLRNGSYYIVHSFALLLFVPLAVCGMRGGASTAIRPITVSNANQYVNQPSETAIVLNTPFAVIRTIGKKNFEDPRYYSPEELDALFTPLHPGSTADSMNRKNVVVLIVESFAREYIGALNTDLENGTYKGYSSFIDSLLPHCLTYRYTLANGRKSIDGMPSVLSGIPMFEEPFILTPYSLIKVSGIAGELNNVGYHTAFFHGAENGSMGFQAFARSTGFQHYFGRTEYNQDARFNGNADFDGTWAIWDEPFLQYYALQMSEMPQPFMTAVFTASSHHPFAIPKKYSSIYPEEGKFPMYKCIRYTDNALRQFFKTAALQPWYGNTLFILTADHTNVSEHAEYHTPMNLFSVPILIYDPSGNLPTGIVEGIAQQTDIMATVLDYLEYPNPYISFGKNLLTTPADSTWAVNYNNGIYQYFEDGYMLQYDGTQILALYNYSIDPALKNNLKGIQPQQEQAMKSRLKAIIQSYMQRMREDKLTAQQ